VIPRRYEAWFGALACVSEWEISGQVVASQIGGLDPCVTTLGALHSGLLAVAWGEC
jgi:hypothetical protein